LKLKISEITLSIDVKIGTTTTMKPPEEEDIEADALLFSKDKVPLQMSNCREQETGPVLFD
jgi:hypothetical protein